MEMFILGLLKMEKYVDKSPLNIKMETVMTDIIKMIRNLGMDVLFQVVANLMKVILTMIYIMEKEN